MTGVRTESPIRSWGTRTVFKAHDGITLVPHVTGDVGWVDSDPDPAHRYQLWYKWGNFGPFLPCLLLNPSARSDYSKPSPTDMLLIHLARRIGFRGVIIGNAFTLRTPTADALMRTAEAERNGPEADQWLDLVLGDTDQPIVCGFGATPLGERARLLRRVTRDRQLLALGTTTGGWPIHPQHWARFRAHEEPHLWFWRWPPE